MKQKIPHLLGGSPGDYPENLSEIERIKHKKLLD